MFQPLPLIVLAQLIVGQQYQVNTGGSTRWVGNRLYVDSGSMLRMGQNTSLSVLNPATSLNVGSRDYISKFDADNDYSPESSNFKALSATDPQVLFTSLYDNTATTTLVPTPINVTNGASPVTLGPALWGSVGIQSGARAVVNAATFRYGGGAINTADVTIPNQSVLAFITNQTTFDTAPSFGQFGSRVYITNNNFYNNFDAAMQVEPDGLMAGNPTRPQSGHPFLRGNVMQGNGIDGLAVLAARTYLSNAASNYVAVGPLEGNFNPFTAGNQFVDALWDLTDITYVLRGTIVLAGFPAAAAPGTTFEAPPAPNTSLTIQSALPGTLLADGTRIASPGASVVVKLLSENQNIGAGTIDANGATGAGASVRAGAGFIAGYDDATEPDGQPVDRSWRVWTQIRILGVPGNQSTASSDPRHPHVPPRHDRRHDGPRRGQQRDLQQLPGRGVLAGLPEPAAQRPAARRRRHDPHRLQLGDDVRRDRPAGKPDRQRRPPLPDADRGPERRRRRRLRSRQLAERQVWLLAESARPGL